MSLRLLYRGPNLEVLHEQYAKRGRTDQMAPVTAAGAVQIEASPERVWQVLSAVADWPAVDPGISAVHLSAGVAVDAPFTWRNGRSRITSRFAVVDPCRELTWTGVSAGAKAVHRHVLQPDAAGATLLESTESMAGPFLTLFYGSEKLAQGMTGWLTAIKAAAEGRSGTGPTGSTRQ